MSSLDRLRVRYDAARRALHAASRAAGAGDVGNPAHTHLIRLEQDSEREWGLRGRRRVLSPVVPHVPLTTPIANRKTGQRA